jgi:putative heme-binding domain-containing protein
MSRICLFLPVMAMACAVARADERDAALAAKDRAVVETLLRLKGVDVNSSPSWKAAALRHLETVKGTPRYVDLVEKLKLRGAEEELFRLAMADPGSPAGAKAAALLVRSGEASRLTQAATGPDEPLALKAIAALGSVGDPAALDALQPLLVDQQRSTALRVAVAGAVGKNRRGQSLLLELARSGALLPDLKFTAANILLASLDEAIRVEAARHLSLPAAADSRPLPPIAELMRQSGDPERGRQVFQTTGTCAKCHKVGGEGKEVGPDLSEIGGKLSPDALYVSILDPNAGISHNYESYVVVTTGGSFVTGLLVSRTDQSVTIRTAEGVDKEIPAREIDELVRSKVSLMPADLQKLLSVQDLVDVVAYLRTLRKEP